MIGSTLTLRGRLLDVADGCSRCRAAALRLAGAHVEAIVPDHGDAQGSALLVPPLVNAHDHVRGIRPIAIGGFDLPLELWLLNMTGMPPVDPGLVALAAFGRQALGGIGSIMVHYTRAQNRDRVADELVTVCRAAADVGVRIGVAVAMRDCNALGYAPDETLLDLLDPADRELVRDKLLEAYPSPAEQVRFVDELAARIEGPLVTVQYGPYGVEWCSGELLRRISERSASTGRRVHMHLLESKLQREYLDATFKQGVVTYLDEIGLLSPRLSVAHGVWLRPEEMELLAQRGVTVSVNASSNFVIRSGVAPVGELAAHGVPLAFGLDGFSVDDDDDAYRELRLNYMLHRGVGLEDGLSIDELLRAAWYGGRWAVNGVAGTQGFTTSVQADVAELDFRALAHDVVDPSVSEASLLVHRATKASMRRLIVGGREIVRDGKLTSVDLDAVHRELDAQVRHAAPAFLDWQQVARRLRDKLRGFYAAGQHACG